MTRLTPRRWRELRGLLVALAATSLATVLALALRGFLGEAPPRQLFFAAVMLSAWYGGLAPGLLSTGLGWLAIDYFFEEPRFDFVVHDPQAWVRLVVYVSVASLISYLNSRQRSARLEAERLAAVVASSQDAVIEVALDGRVVSWNGGAEQLYGYAAAEVRGQSLALLAPQADADVVPRVAAELRRGNRFGHFEAARVTKDGRLLDVSVTVSPVLDEDGEVTGASLVERDVTHRRQAGDADQRLAAIVRSSSDAILSIALDKTITAFNPAAEELYGYPAHEAVGCSLEMLVPPEKRREMDESLERAARGEATEGLATIRMRRDGRRIRVTLSIFPVRGIGGAVTGAASIARLADDAGNPVGAVSAAGRSPAGEPA